MLGLNNSMLHQETLVQGLVHSYSSDFTSSVDGWEGWSIQGSLTLASNTNPYDDLGGSAPDSDGWLKVTYDTNQTNSSGLQTYFGWPSGGNPVTGGNQSGDYHIFGFTIYIVDDSGKWGSSPPITIKIYPHSSPAIDVDVPLDTATTVSGLLTSSINTGVPPNCHWAFQIPADMPQAGAVYYVKDINQETFGVR